MQVGLNDWGMIINNTTTYKQVAALDLKTVEVHHKPNTNYLEVTHRKKDFVATITTPQVRKGFLVHGKEGLPRKGSISKQDEHLETTIDGCGRPIVSESPNAGWRGAAEAGKR